MDDAFLVVTMEPTGEPQDLAVSDNFNCLQQTGDFCADPAMQLTPFVQALPIPPIAQPVDSLNPPIDPTRHQLYDQYPAQNLYEVDVRVAQHQFHPDLPPATIWGFNGLPMGETYVARYGEPYLIRFHNNLPPNGDGTGFGKPEITIHLHNAHTASESDGFPLNFFPSGQYWDNHHAMFLAGGDPREALGTLWYHDHRADFTAQNVYKGLAGFTIYYDEFDSGDENDPNPDAFRLPSGEYDVPLLLADKRFNTTPDHDLYMDIFNTDGFIGDQYTVNMAIQPYFEVAARKYRFRLLNGGPSRFYHLALSTGDPMVLIANDGNLLPKPVIMKDGVRLTVAERMDVVVDFSKYPVGTELYLLNLADQIGGRRPQDELLPAEDGIQMMKFIVTREAEDPSRIPKKMREIPTIHPDEIVRVRELIFNNENGIWTINGKAFDYDRVDINVQKGTAEHWILTNASGDWEHPVHIHMEEHQIITRNGKKPPKEERGRKDVTTLRPGEVVEIFIRFRDLVGRYPIHCHNTVHEDHAMMLRWDVDE